MLWRCGRGSPRLRLRLQAALRRRRRVTPRRHPGRTAGGGIRVRVNARLVKSICGGRNLNGWFKFCRIESDSYAFQVASELAGGTVC